MFNTMLPQQDMTILACPIDKVYSAALCAANERGKVKTSDETLHRITYTTGVSLASWGRLVTVQLVPYMENTQVIVSSHLKTSAGSRSASAIVFSTKENKMEIEKFMGLLSQYVY